MEQEQTYSALASIYDEVMYDVDYELWANFIDDILQIHHPDPHTLLELACGTGSLALSLDELNCYDITATDKSDKMLEVARKKSGSDTYNLTFKQVDFTQIELEKRFDAAILLFDSINYLHTPGQIVKLLNHVEKVLHPGGLFIFDFTTPRNSRLAVKTLHNEKRKAAEDIEYERSSIFDKKQRLHTNEFTIRYLDTNSRKIRREFTELHKQKIYTLNEILDIVSRSSFSILNKYSGFELKEATHNSLRITLVLKCPQTP